MGFKLHKDAREYFRLIEKSNSKFKMMFDQFYLFLMLGLKEAKLGKSEQLEEFVNGYPEPYADKSEIFIGLLIDAEMRRQDIAADDRIGVEGLILKLIDHNSNTRLSEYGLELLNLYAAFGFDLVREKIARTAEIETFLVHYYNLINQAS